MAIYCSEFFLFFCLSFFINLLYLVFSWFFNYFPLCYLCTSISALFGNISEKLSHFSSKSFHSHQQYQNHHYKQTINFTTSPPPPLLLPLLLPLQLLVLLLLLHLNYHHYHHHVIISIMTWGRLISLFSIQHFPLTATSLNKPAQNFMAWKRSRNC